MLVHESEQVLQALKINLAALAVLARCGPATTRTPRHRQNCPSYLLVWTPHWLTGEMQRKVVQQEMGGMRATRSIWPGCG